uniref:Tyrosine-protein kinase receptor n=1 Tax=Globodera pallida TaxID=36090 RepID=A0A183BJD7_GLOPA
MAPICHWKRRNMGTFAAIIGFVLSSTVARSAQADGTAAYGGDSAICSFESERDCPYWIFVNSEELRLSHLHHSLGALPQSDNGTSSPQGTTPPTGSPNNNNFYVVLSGGGSASNHYATRQIVSASLNNKQSDEPVAMLITPFFVRSAPQCELLFRYRLLGERGAELLVVTEQLSLRSLHPDSPQEEDEDWTRPTLRARFEVDAASGEPWSHARVSIGTFGFPTRIRVECHPPPFSDGSPNSEDLNGAELRVECSVDDLELTNCKEELWRGGAEGDASCSEGKLACRLVGGGVQHCLGMDHICDMHSDCEEGEDELEDVHHCSQVPDGAKCDFEDLRWPGGCAHWRIFSGQAGGTSQSNGSSSAARHLASLSDARQRRAGIPPGEYLYEGRHYRPGHFLFFSSYEHHQQNGQHDIVYSSATSPPFPRLSNDAKCTLRFFYCHTGYSPFQVFFLRRNSPQEMAKPLWAPPKDDHVREPCEWRRAAVEIAPTIATGEYSLKLSFAKLADSVGSIAIDDLSLSPGCFNKGGMRPLPGRLSLKACDGKKCDEESSSELSAEKSSAWTVATSAEYRLELAGAAGGTFPGRNDDAWGDVLVANVRLEAGKEIAVLLGGRGKCLCDDETSADGKQNAEMQNVLCHRPLGVLPNSTELPGCGGGGASLLFYGGNLVAVAGGGGGDFPARGFGDFQSKRRAAGRGVSLEGPNLNTSAAVDGCEGTECIDGHIFGHDLRDVRGGKCPRGTRWSFGGGIGGGGASCGPGGGGGGGLKGGDGGFLGPGQSGSSLLPPLSPPSARSIGPRANPGPGRLLLFACPQALCPPSSNCSFAPPQPKMAPRARCICLGGRQVPLNGSCTILPSILERLLPPEDQIPPMLLLSILLLVLLSALLSLLCCVQLCRRSKSSAHCTDVHELMAIAAEAGGPAASDGRGHCGGNRISGNPIYEPLLLSSLPQIPRHFLRLEKSIGHGAFGEVFEGYLQDSAGSSTKVAIKSLPVESARDFGDDFETEARLLSQFKHENIVNFFGVSFEQQPKFIVLEFLEGGDLKKFLRENRPRPDTDPTTLKMADLLSAASDVARGCEHLEATRFVHRDIAARNCLLTAKIGRRVVKIADFGMARDIYRNDYYRKGGKAFLPVRWMPPESFLDGLFTSKTDVWAFGVLLWEIFSLGYIPYSGRENHEVMRLIVAGDRLDPPIGVPSELYDIMLCCWNTDAEKRPSFADLVALFDALLKRVDLTSEPLPPIRHRLANERSISATPSMSRSGDPHPTSTTSQATVSTVLSSAPEGSSITTSTYESMPTMGDGVCRAVFPPYQTRQIGETGLMSMDGRRLEAQASLSSSSSSHDSTLHESAGTVKLRHCIRRPPPLSLSTLRPLPRPCAPPPRSCPGSAALPPQGGDPNQSPGSKSQANRSPFATHRNHSLPPLSATKDTDRGDQDSGIASSRSIASADAALLIEPRRD